MNTGIPTFLNGTGIWIWELWTCCGKDSIDKVTLEDIAALIQKLTEHHVKYIIVKSGDGEHTWQQWNKELVAAFAESGIALCSWSYVYGDNPLREAAIANWSLDLGSKLHVFDAEEEYQGKPTSAKIMLEAVRQHAPQALLAYAPFPIIDYHLSYPYLEFGKYCDLVMPQIYWGDFLKSPVDALNWTYQQWSKWEKTWKNNGFAESIKPLIPLGQAYDNPDPKVLYEESGKDIADFIQAAKGYYSCNFWSFQHMYKPEVWEAIRNTKVDPLPGQVETAPTQTDNQDKQTVPVEAPSTQPESVPASTTTTTPEPTSTGSISTPQQITPQPPIVGSNSGNGVTLPPKKHIDYVIDFVLFLLKLLHLS